MSNITYYVSIAFERDEAGELVEFMGVAMDVTAQRLVDRELQSSASQLRALASQVDRVREEEDTRIARELHDELGSSLTSLKWDLEDLENSLGDKQRQDGRWNTLFRHRFSQLLLDERSYLSLRQLAHCLSVAKSLHPRVPLLQVRAKLAVIYRCCSKTESGKA